MKKYDLEERIVSFASNGILFLTELPADKAGNHLSGQLIRSSSSAAFNFGEAQGGESVKDQIHKLGIVLKELKETRVGFKILRNISYGEIEQRQYLLNECNELIAITATIIKNKKRLL